MKKEILIVLGAPNSPSGTLSEISKSRLDLCAKIYAPGKRVLCTGGWGSHFNVSEEPHALHARRYLMKKGLPEEAFLDFALSRNTVDDAVKIREIITPLKEVHLTVITSDYHVERVRLIFSRILNDFDIAYLGATTKLSDATLEKLIEHERAAIRSINETGLYY